MQAFSHNGKWKISSINSLPKNVKFCARDSSDELANECSFSKQTRFGFVVQFIVTKCKVC